MACLPANSKSLSLLLRLLDDDTPEVRASLTEALDAFDGDVSEFIGEADGTIDAEHTALLSGLLLPARRTRLRREWIVPVAGLPALEDDWDRAEAMLRVISDYLHDGVTVRQALGDAIDLLTEECEPAFFQGGAPGVISKLLGERILRPDPNADFNPKHLDLAAVASGERTNAIGSGLVVLLVARRLGANISAINLPGALFLSINASSGTRLIDPASRGVTIPPEDFAHRIRRYPREIRQLASRPATPGELLLRVTEELATSFAVTEADEDARLMEELVVSLVGQA